MKIKNINDFVEFKTTNLFQVSPNQIEIKNLDDVWDGPLSGECKVSSEEKYFFCFSDNETPGMRKYFLIDLDEQQKKIKETADSKFLDLQGQKITIEEYEQFVSENFLVINPKQITSWFCVDDSSKNSIFMESYFRLMNL